VSEPTQTGQPNGAITTPPPGCGAWLQAARSRLALWWHQITQRSSQPRPESAPEVPSGEGKEPAEQSQIAERLRAVLDALTTYVLPRPKLLRNEEILLEIHQAWYRHTLPMWILSHWWLIFIVTGLLMLAVVFITLRAELSPWMAMLLLILPITMFLWAAEEVLRFKQWRLLITNRRTIIYVPDPRSWLLVDSARLQAGKIQVIDTSFSTNPWWGLLQSVTGARDLIISMSGYEFKPNSAEVKGGLIFPDVMQEDINALEEIVFPKK